MGISTYPNNTVATAKRLAPNLTKTTLSTQPTSNTTDRIAMAYGNGMHVAIQCNRGVWTSTDGKNWTAIANNAPVNAAIPSTIACWEMVWSGSYWLSAWSDGSIWKTTDLVTWTQQNSGPLTVSSNFRLAYKSSTTTWVLESGASVSGQHLAYSTDQGVTWTNSSSNYETATATTTGRTYGLIFSGTNFVVTAAAGKIATSPDGITWTNRTNPFGANAIFSVASNGSRLVAIGASGTWAYSDDHGVTWTANTVIAAGANTNWHVAWDGTNWLIVDGTESVFYYSATGIGAVTSGATFTITVATANNHPFSINTSNGTVCYLSGDKMLYTTTPRVSVTTGNRNWLGSTTTPANTTNNLNMNKFIKDNNGKYYLVGYGAGATRPVVYTSTDNGTTWVYGGTDLCKTDVTTAAANSFAYSHAYNFNGNILVTSPSIATTYKWKYSTDNGATYSDVVQPALGSTAYNIMYNGTNYVVVTGAAPSSNTTFQYTTSLTGGGTWTQGTTALANSTQSSTDSSYYNGLFYSSHPDNYAYVSSDGINWNQLSTAYLNTAGTAATLINTGVSKVVLGKNNRVVLFANTGTASTAEKPYMGFSSVQTGTLITAGTTASNLYFSECNVVGVNATAFNMARNIANAMTPMYANYSDDSGYVVVWKDLYNAQVRYWILTSIDGMTWSVVNQLNVGGTGTLPLAEYFGRIDDKLFIYISNGAANVYGMYGSSGTEIVSIPL